MFKSWRKATANSKAGRISRGFHRVLSRVALPALLIAALVATPLQILGDPAEVALAQEDPILVSFEQATYNVLEGNNAEVELAVVASREPDAELTIPIAAMGTGAADLFTTDPLPTSVTIAQGQTRGTTQLTVRDNDVAADSDGVVDFSIDGANLPAGTGVGTPSIARVIIIDDDSPNIQLSAFSQSVFEGTDFTPNDEGTEASQSEATWTVQLTEDPGADVVVTVTIASSDPGAATVDKTSIKFSMTADTNSNVFAWDREQTVTVTGAEDVDFVKETVTFTHSVSGGDYSAAASRAVNVSVTDDDTPEIIISPSNMKVQGRRDGPLHGQAERATV